MEILIDMKVFYKEVADVYLKNAHLDVLVKTRVVNIPNKKRGVTVQKLVVVAVNNNEVNVNGITNRPKGGLLFAYGAHYVDLLYIDIYLLSC